jgi:Rod binding domain-containing protein
MSAPVILGGAVGAIGAPPAPKPQTLAEAAQQFEAVMIGQLLKEAQGDEGGWLGSDADAGSATAAGLAEEQFAQALAHSGGLGLSAQIVSSLSARGVEPTGGSDADPESAAKAKSSSFARRTPPRTQ